MSTGSLPSGAQQHLYVHESSRVSDSARIGSFCSILEDVIVRASPPFPSLPLTPTRQIEDGVVIGSSSVIGPHVGISCLL